MVKRSRTKWLVVIISVLAIVALGLWCTRYTWGEWLFELEVAHTGAWLPEVDQADVFLLGSPIPNINRQGPPPEYYMGYPIESQVTVSNEDAREVAQQWRAIPRGNKYISLCHDPLYGLRFRRGNKIILETTVCWSCETYDVSAENSAGLWEWGFDAHSTPAQLLLGILVKKVPPPAREQENILKEFPESSPARSE